APVIKLPMIGPVTVPDDPQKGRFGGESESNGRVLKASVVESKYIPEFYNLSIWVESTDKDKPLDSDVIFYLHDSFRPAVYTIKQEDFKDGIAIDDDLLSYGAFTVGVVTDNGNTLLELDLADNPGFPEKFRKR
ncbi:MAG: pYEATS domain-containing protein, partial [Mucilaginibacter sp.]